MFRNRSENELLMPVQVPLALTDEFAQDQLKQRQWEGFLRRGEVLLSSSESTCQLRGNGFLILQ